MTRREFHRSLAGLAVAGPVLATGCSNGPDLTPVSGIVTIDGKPVTHGKVQIAPAGYRAAIGTIGPDGRFTMSTDKDGDGVVVGSHKAAVIAHETKGPGSQVWHAPKRYMSIETSGITVDVVKGKDVEIKLTWEGSGNSGPFTERAEKE